MHEQKDPGETRRGFLKRAAGVLALVNGLVLGVPMIGSLLGAVKKTGERPWTKLATLGSLPEGRPVEVKFKAVVEDAFHYRMTLQSAWVIRHSEERLTVFSPVCTHLGCHFLWNKKTGHFECPCHASIFAQDGTVISGPAPRRLDTLEHRIENGDLLVRLERFKSGTARKVTVEA